MRRTVPPPSTRRRRNRWWERQPVPYRWDSVPYLDDDGRQLASDINEEFSKVANWIVEQIVGLGQPPTVPHNPRRGLGNLEALR